MPFDGTISPPLAQKLNECADLLEREGWCQYAPRSAAGERCMVAVMGDISADSLSFFIDMSRAVRSYLPLDYNYPISRWNDDPARTAEEVIAAFRGAAAAVAFPQQTASRREADDFVIDGCEAAH